jgi:hypothetical protein
MPSRLQVKPQPPEKTSGSSRHETFSYFAFFGPFWHPVPGTIIQLYLDPHNNATEYFILPDIFSRSIIMQKLNVFVYLCFL